MSTNRVERIAETWKSRLDSMPDFQLPKAEKRSGDAPQIYRVGIMHNISKHIKPFNS